MTVRNEAVRGSPAKQHLLQGTLRHVHRRPDVRRTALALLLLLGSAAAGTSASPSAARVPVTDLRPLLTRAAAEGRAHGTLVGAGAQAIARRFQTDAPIEVDIRRIQLLPMPGCSRLEVITRQRDVTQAGQRGDQQLVYRISYCADGRIPDQR